MQNTAPYVAHIDINGGNGRPSRADVLSEFETIPLRYTLRLDHEYPHQSIIKVFAYSPEGRGWNEIWTIDGEAYDLGSGYNLDQTVELANEMVDALFGFVAKIL